MAQKPVWWKQMLSRYQEQIQYLFWGVMTTVVNYIVFWLLTTLTQKRWVLLCNALAFVVAVAFAFVVNKIFVFRSKDWGRATLLREAGSFLAARLFSFGIEELGLWLATDVLLLDQRDILGVDGLMVTKVILSVVVIILNYIFSKLFVFRKSGKDTDR